MNEFTCCVFSPGYGHTSPLSDVGKAFSIVYALIGVPFTMLVLTACVQRLMVPLNLRPVASWRRRFGWHSHTASTAHFVLLLLLVIVLFFLVPALVFSTIEDSWSFLEAFYFCFISLCTIGLGDFVPGEQPNQKLRPLYKISVMGKCISTSITACRSVCAAVSSRVCSSCDLFTL